MQKKVPVIVTTKYRGVFFGYLEHAGPDVTECTLHDASMAIHWGTTKGVAQLAAAGPTVSSKLSDVVPRWHLRDVVSVIECADAAAEAWRAALS